MRHYCGYALGVLHVSQLDVISAVKSTLVLAKGVESRACSLLQSFVEGFGLVVHCRQTEISSCATKLSWSLNSSTHIDKYVVRIGSGD